MADSGQDFDKSVCTVSQLLFKTASLWGASKGGAVGYLQVRGDGVVITGIDLELSILNTNIQRNGQAQCRCQYI